MSSPPSQENCSAESNYEADLDIESGSELHDLASKARKLASQGSFLLATRLYARVLRRHSPNIDSGIWREFNVLLGARKLGSRREQLIWKSTEGFLDRRFERIKTAVLKGDAVRASSDFRTYASGIYCDHCLPKLVAAIEAISLGGSPKSEQLQQILDRYREGPAVVIVAGMNWSGSSAVFDFLREFDDAVAVETEIPHLSRGQFNLAQVWKVQNDADQLRTASIEFLFRYLFGFSKVREAMDFRIYKFARRKLFSSRACDYSQSVIECAVIVSAICSQSVTANADVLIRALANIVLTKLVTSESVGDSKVLVLNNAVKAVNLSQDLPLTHSTAFSVFRDPRDCYVAEVQEKHNLGIPVDPWIRSARRRYEIATSIIGEAEQHGSRKRVIKIQFEEFVTSETERFRVRNLAGLESSSRSEQFTFFDAEKSQSNIDIFRNYDDEYGVSRIEKLMPNYLWE